MVFNLRKNIDPHDTSHPIGSPIRLNKTMKQFPDSIDSKSHNLSTNIFSFMGNLAEKHGAFNLAQGYPDFEAPPELTDRVHHYMRQGFNQYAPMPGVFSLRDAVSRKIHALYGAHIDPENETTITVGATQAIFTAFSAIIRKGDEVILFAPAYESYAPNIAWNGGIPVYAKLDPPGYTVDWDRVQRLISPRTRLIVINSPHNPTGAVLSKEDMLRLQNLTSGTDIMILSDEVYEHIIFDAAEHQSLLRFPGLAKRSFVVFSFGKTFHTTGWKIGCCIAPEGLTREFRKLHQYIVYSAITPVQYAFADILKDDRHYRKLGRFYQDKRDRFLGLLQNSRFHMQPAAGAFFQLLDFHDITEESDLDFAVRLTRESGVATIPVSIFNPGRRDERALRVCFAKHDETLLKAAEILCRI